MEVATIIENLLQHKRKILKIVGIWILILLMLQMIIPLYYTSKDGIEANEQKIKIVTYNIRDTSLSNLIEIFTEVDADIIGLQEINDSPHSNISSALEEFASKLDLHLVPFDNEVYETFGLALLSRYNINSSEWIDISFIDVTSARAAIQAIIETPNGSIQIINTHLNTPNFYTTRGKQLNTILDTWQTNETTVLIGDFNTPNYILDYTYNKLSAEFEDSWVVAGNFHGTGKTYPTGFPVLRVDYIFVSYDMDVIQDSARTFGTSELSDHKGVMVSVVN